MSNLTKHRHLFYTLSGKPVKRADLIGIEYLDLIDTVGDLLEFLPPELLRYWAGPNPKPRKPSPRPAPVNVLKAPALRLCGDCGTSFNPAGPHQEFCTPQCQDRFWTEGAKIRVMRAGRNTEARP